ncbi:MAG: membrane dipeptidase [Parachlamydiales bacterium]
MKYPIIDLHCDLLLYLAADRRRTPIDPASRCSVPQLQEGGVSSQVFAIYTDTKKGSTTVGERQFQLLSAIKGVNVLASIENGSVIAEEDEPLEAGLKRLGSFIQRKGKFAYLSLTWNDENRFGGGNNSNNVGLKADGKILLEKLAELNIPVDLSHTSDKLAEGILNYIDAAKLNLPVLASHSNSRSVCNHLRNLPDEIAQEIFKRGGVIGLNFVMHIVGGNTFEDIYRHYAHFKKWGGEDKVCFGADFFSSDDLPESLKKLHTEWFPAAWPNSSCYPHLLKDWINKEYISKETAQKLANENARRFFLEKTQITDI